MAGVVSCFAERLTANVWARRVESDGPSGPYRKIVRIHRQVVYGTPELVVMFTDGTSVRTRPNAVWEVDE